MFKYNIKLSYRLTLRSSRIFGLGLSSLSSKPERWERINLRYLASTGFSLSPSGSTIDDANGSDIAVAPLLPTSDWLIGLNGCIFFSIIEGMRCSWAMLENLIERHVVYLQFRGILLESQTEVAASIGRYHFH